MEELIDLVSQKTGLSEEMAHKAVETVIGFLKERLPEPLAGQVEALLGGDADVGDLLGNVDDIAKGLGGLFGGKK